MAFPHFDELPVEMKGNLAIFTPAETPRAFCAIGQKEDQYPTRP